MPKVSIIVPTYNREQYISKCVDSVLNQTLKDIELIIIDDGSTDCTEKIIKNYTDKRLKYIKRTNHGIGNSRNYGIDLAKGEFIAFVDSDDYIHPENLEKMYKKALNDNLDAVVCDYNYFYENGSVKPQKIEYFENTSLINNPDLLLKINLGPCNKLFSRKLFADKKMRFPENIKYEDIPLVSKLLKDANKIGKVNESLSFFLVDNYSETFIVDKRVFDIFKSLDMVISNFIEEEFNDTIKKLVICILTNYTIQQRRQIDKSVRNKFIDKAFEYIKRIDPEYKKNVYFKRRNKLKSIIEKNKILTKIYCNIYIFIKKPKNL